MPVSTRASSRRSRSQSANPEGNELPGIAESIREEEGSLAESVGATIEATPATPKINGRHRSRSASKAASAEVSEPRTTDLLIDMAQENAALRTSLEGAEAEIKALKEAVRGCQADVKRLRTESEKWRQDVGQVVREAKEAARAVVVRDEKVGEMGPPSARATSPRSAAEQTTRARPTQPQEVDSLSWTWKSFKRAGERFYDLVRHPDREHDLRGFIKNGNAALRSMPPLLARWESMRDDVEYAGYYQRVLKAVDGRMEREAIVRRTREMLTEYVALYLITTAVGARIPLRAYLALGQMQPAEACTLSESDLKDIDVRSAVSKTVLELAPTAVWAIHLPPGNGWRTGEDICNLQHYQRTMREYMGGAQFALPPGAGLPGQSVVHRSVTEVQSLRPTSFVAPASQRGARVDYRNPPWAPGPVRVSGRCMRCGRRGHVMTSCRHSPHELFRQEDTGFLLRQMAQGAVKLPD